jgi:hypothetical protein
MTAPMLRYVMRNRELDAKANRAAAGVSFEAPARALPQGI